VRNDPPNQQFPERGSVRAFLSPLLRLPRSPAGARPSTPPGDLLLKITFEPFRALARHLL